MKQLLIVGIFILFNSLVLHSQETRIIVRAKAKDAKFIGTSIGGAYVIIKDANTGKTLAEGLISGSTGNTDRIMKKAHERHVNLSDDQTAKFHTTLSLNEPTFVTVEVIAPYSAKNAQIKSQTQLWLIPGKHLEGDGIVVEIPGFIVDVLTPQRHSRVSLSNQESFELKANIVMMCGCPITKGGTWNSDDLSVEAMIKIDGKVTDTIGMEITTTASTFHGKIPLKNTGNYEIVITAYNSKSGNTGVGKMNFIVGN